MNGYVKKSNHNNQRQPVKLPQSVQVLELISCQSLGSAGPSNTVRHSTPPSAATHMQNQSPIANVVAIIQPVQHTFATPSPDTAMSDPTRWSQTLTLANGLKITYTEDDLAPPKSINGYMSNLEALYAAWDETAPKWKDVEEHSLVVRGQPIPMRLWADWYQSFPSKKATLYWAQIKQQWSNFKVEFLI